MRIGLGLLILAAASPATAQFSFGPQLSAEELAKAIDAARAHPLGSRENPVRADMPRGQRAYLSRLRCEDGSTPQFGRTGNLGPGIYQTIIDHYVVDCGASAPGKVEVIMDMYHPGHAEAEAIKGFTIEPAVQPANAPAPI